MIAAGASKTATEREVRARVRGINRGRLVTIEDREQLRADLDGLQHELTAWMDGRAMPVEDRPGYRLRLGLVRCGIGIVIRWYAGGCEEMQS